MNTKHGGRSRGAIALSLQVHLVGDRLPEADTDVIVFLEGGDSTLGALDADGWVDCAGTQFSHLGERVVAWAAFPSLEEEP
jgi:hypothetical protein